MRKKLLFLFISFYLVLLPVASFADDVNSTITSEIKSSMGKDKNSNIIVVKHQDNLDYEFQVESREMVSLYYNIFTGISKIFNWNDQGSTAQGGEVADTYKSLLKLIVGFGSFFVLMIGVAESWGRGGQGAIQKYLVYILSVTGLLAILMSQKVTIFVHTDDIATTCNSGGQSAFNQSDIAVDNIPMALAYTLSFTNKFGYELAKLVEDAYYPPNARNNGIFETGGFAGGLKDSLKILSYDIDKIARQKGVLSDQTPKVDMGNVLKTLISKCILVPLSAKGEPGQQDIETFKRSPNLMNQLTVWLKDGNKTKHSQTNLSLLKAEFAGDIVSCKELFTTYVEPALNDIKTNLACANKDVSKAGIQLITGASDINTSTFSEVAIQSGLIEQLAKTEADLGTEVPGMAYASGKTRAEFIQSNKSVGAYMAEILPYLQMTIRALLYAFFPFIFAIILLPGGLKVLAQYLKTLIWVELWTPTAAILNMFIYVLANKDIAGKFQDDGGVTLYNSIDMLSSGSTIAGTVGYLYASVPALTWLILTGSAYMLSSIGSAASAGMAKNIQTETTNRDQAALQGAREMSLRTGEDIGIAESLHFEAQAMGASKGSELAVQKKTGLDAVSDKSAFEAQRSLSSVSMAVHTTGESAENLGSNSAAINASENITNSSVGQTISDGHSLNETGKASTARDAVSKQSEINAKANSVLTKKDIEKHATVKVDGQVAKDSSFLEQMRTEHDPIVNDLKAKGMNEGQINSAITNRGFTTEAAQKFENLMHNKARLEEIVGKDNMHETDNGSYKLTKEGVQKLTNFASKNAGAKVFNERKTQAEVRELNKEHMSANEVGKGQADQTIKSTKNIESNIKAAKAVFNTESTTEALSDAANVQNISHVNANGEVVNSTIDSNKGKEVTASVSKGRQYNEAGAILHNAAKEFLRSSDLGKGLTDQQIDKAAETFNKTIQNTGAVFKEINSASSFVKALSGNSKKVGAAITAALGSVVAASQLKNLKNLDQGSIGASFINTMKGLGNDTVNGWKKIGNVTEKGTNKAGEEFNKIAEQIAKTKKD